ncbi:MAG TPA: helix-turn-helix domain-containing protein [Dehalococcoidia bacterium]|nr:helix-turn-helix domain-containing protein [Dehalococcoidia bacterium]
MLEPTNQAKRKQITALRKAGLSYAEIGRRLGFSKERVRQIDKKIPGPKKPAPEFDTLLMPRNVARLLGIHVNTVRRWADRGFLKAYNIGPRGDRRFRQRDIESLLVAKSSASKR